MFRGAGFRRVGAFQRVAHRRAGCVRPVCRAGCVRPVSVLAFVECAGKVEERVGLIRLTAGLGPCCRGQWGRQIGILDNLHNRRTELREVDRRGRRNKRD